jgi:hypothetical protein
MSKEIREQIDRVRNFKNTLTENINEKLSFLNGKPISLIRTRKSMGKYNPEKGEMDEIVDIDEIFGYISNIGIDPDGRNGNGFTVIDDDGKKLCYVFYDKYAHKYGNQYKFIDGDYGSKYTYAGTTKKDYNILQLIIHNLE